MRRLIPIELTLSLFTLMGLSLPVCAQDVQVEAPQISVGDWHLVRDREEESLLTVTSVDADGVRVTDDPGYGRPAVTHYDVQLNLVKSEHESWTNYFDPSTMRYSFPLFVGKSWKGYFDARSEDLEGNVDMAYRRSYDCEVQCIEVMNVPAGRFETFKIVCEIQDSDESTPGRNSYWYSPTAAMSVRQVSEKLQANAAWVISFEQVLVEFNRAAAVEFDVLPDGVESTCNAAISMNGTSVPAHN